MFCDFGVENSPEMVKADLLVFTSMRIQDQRKKNRLFDPHEIYIFTNLRKFNDLARKGICLDKKNGNENATALTLLWKREPSNSVVQDTLFRY